MEDVQLDYLDILTVFDGDFIVGLNLFEIDRIDKQAVSKASAEDIRKVQSQENYVDLHSLLTGNQRPLDSLIYLKQSYKDEPYILGISGDYEIEHFEENRVMITPQFIRKRQNPFMHWGFIIYKDELMPLISFEYFHKEKFHGQ